MPTTIDRGVLNLLDTQGVILSIAAKDAAGTVGGVPASEYSWASGDPAVASLESQSPDPDDRELTEYERWAGTPAAGGTSVVTVTHTPSGNTETLTLIVAATGPGEIGLSAGQPTAEV